MSITRVNQQKIETYVSMIDDLLQILDRLENCGSGTDNQHINQAPVIGKIGFSDMKVEIGMEYFLYINLFGPPKEGIFDPALLNKARRQMCIDSGENTEDWPCNRCNGHVCNSCGLCPASGCNFCKCNAGCKGQTSVSHSSTVCGGGTGATGGTIASYGTSLCGKHGCICSGCTSGATGATGCSICNDPIYPLGWTGSTQWSLLGATGTTGCNDTDTSAQGPCCRSCGPLQPSGCGRCYCHSRISVASYVMALPVYVDPNGNTVIMQGGNNFISGGGGGFISGGINNTTINNTTNNTTINNTSSAAGSNFGSAAGVTGASGREIDSDTLGILAKLGVPLN